MFSKEDLITDALPPIYDSKLSYIKELCANSNYKLNNNIYESYKETAKHYFASSKRNNLIGLDQFEFVDATIGCTHYIDNLIQTYSISGLQIFEHDYKYYQRLDPFLKFAKIGQLEKNKPILIAAPFPGYLNLHIDWQQILDECSKKQIDIHIDGCWMGAATDITLDLNHTSIKSICFSLSKCLGMSWNRVGMRFCKQSYNDSISIQNKFNMIPEFLLHNAMVAMDTLPIDYLWDTYESKYNNICKHLLLRPSKIIYAAHSIDRKKLYGLKKLIEQG
jgi:hypothetical protein